MAVYFAAPLSGTETDVGSPAATALVQSTVRMSPGDDVVELGPAWARRLGERPGGAVETQRVDQSITDHGAGRHGHGGTCVAARDRRRADVGHGLAAGAPATCTEVVW